MIPALVVAGAVAGGIGAHRAAKKKAKDAKIPEETWTSKTPGAEWADEVSGLDEEAKKYLDTDFGVQGSEAANPEFVAPAQPAKKPKGKGKGKGKPGEPGEPGAGGPVPGRVAQGPDAQGIRETAEELGSGGGQQDILDEAGEIDELTGRIKDWDPAKDRENALQDFDLSGFDFSGGEGGWEEEMMREGMGRIMSADQLDPANDPTMQGWMDALRQENRETLEQDVLDIGDQFEGGNMFGTSLRALESARTRDDAAENLLNQQAEQMFGARQAALDRQLQGSGLLSGRDIDLRGIRQKGEMAGAELGLQQATSIDEIDAERDIAESEMELGAMGLEGQLGIDQAGLMAQVEQLRQSGLGAQADALQGLLDTELGQQGIEAGIKQSKISANAQRFGDQAANQRALMADRLQRELFNAGMSEEQVRNYFDMVMGPASEFGTTYQKRTGHKDPGPDPMSAGIMGAMGGAMGMAGIG